MRLLIQLYPHVLSSRLRPRKGSPGRRLPRPRPRLLRRRRLHLLPFLYRHNPSKDQPHHRQVTAVYQRVLVLYVVHIAGHLAALHPRVPARKVDLTSNPCRSRPRPSRRFLTTASYRLSPAASESKNKFVHLALQKTLSLALEAKGPAELEQALGSGLDVTIVGDNDFYSQQDQARIPPLSSPMPPATGNFAADHVLTKSFHP